jgi:hypothetical protein
VPARAPLADLAPPARAGRSRGSPRAPQVAAGAQLRPGVYFYRLEAGPFRDRKKMVVLPR